MIDMHSHIIPAIDDGSRNVKETFNMIKEAKEVGFTDIIMTPHFLLNSYEPDKEEINLLKNKFQEILKNENISLNIYIQVLQFLYCSYSIPLFFPVLGTYFILIKSLCSMVINFSITLGLIELCGIAVV